MSPEIISVLVLAGLFTLATVRNVHLGATALGASWIVGTTVFDVSLDDVIAGFPASLFLTLVGVTYLFAFAENAGAITAIVNAAVRLVRGMAALLPWVMFAVTALITAVGALTPAAAAIVGPIAMGFARKHKIHPVLMGMAVVQGASAGSFSPVGVYGVIINGVVAKNDLPNSPMFLFGISLGFILLTVVTAFFAFGGLALMRRVRRLDMEPDGDVEQLRTQRAPMIAALLGIAGLAVGAFGFKFDIGFLALVVVVVLASIFPAVAKGAVSKICWPTALLVCGVVTYVKLLENQGVVDWLGDGVAKIGSPLFAALLILLIGAIVSALASTTGILGALIPLAVPFLLTGQVWAIGLVAALGVSSSVVDCSPFSTNGALMVAYTVEDERDAAYKQFLLWGSVLVIVGPLVSWLALVVLPSVFS